MGKTVILAEKPSVGRDIARVLGCSNRGEGFLQGNGYLVTWAVGHLVTLCEPDEMDEKYKKWRADTLPMLPDNIPLKVISSSRAQYAIVKKLINAPDTDKLICATDAGREGELIFRYIYEKTGCKKPFDRLWINSMTDEAIRDGFHRLKPGSSYNGLYASAKCRSLADWYVGMNASRAFSLRYNAHLSVGRVQTPTLAILVHRQKEIADFKPQDYWTVTANFGDYKGEWFDPKKEDRMASHLASPESAQAIADAVKGQPAVVRLAETTRKRDWQPQLYDLTSLQRDANKLLGFTADKTLKLAQSLYEKHKALTYPRTDSRYLPPDMIPKVVHTMQLLPASYQPLVPGALPDGKLPVSKRTIDETKVTDHHALIPTDHRVDPATFSEDERQLYDLVVRRMLQAFYPVCEYDATKVITESAGLSFRSNGRVVIRNGWKDIAPLGNPPKTRRKAEEETAELPPLKIGDERKVHSTAIKQDKTKGPLPHNDASLLAAMETAGKDSEDEEIVRQMKGSGIGTPATRASIIERLIQVGYVVRKGRNLEPTRKGVDLIAVMPQEIASAETTGRWEKALDEITDGRQDPGRFMEGIRRLTTFLTDYALKSADESIHFENDVSSKGRGKKKSFGKAVPGCVCPVCGQGKVLETDRGFTCDRYREGCHFSLWKDCLSRNGGPELTAALTAMILQKKQVRGSTGVIVLDTDHIAFYPTGSSTPTAYRSLVWEKQAAN